MKLQLILFVTALYSLGCNHPRPPLDPSDHWRSAHFQQYGRINSMARLLTVANRAAEEECAKELQQLGEGYELIPSDVSLGINRVRILSNPQHHLAEVSYLFTLQSETSDAIASRRIPITVNGGPDRYNFVVDLVTGEVVGRHACVACVDKKKLARLTAPLII